MRTSLPERAKLLRARLVNLDNLSLNVLETRSLEELRHSLKQPAERLRNVVEQYKLLEDSGIQTPKSEPLVSARKLAAKVLDGFKLNPKAATLTRGVGWATLLKQVDLASDDLDAGLQKAWKTYRLTLFNGDPPQLLKNRIALTDANMKAFKAYEKLYNSWLFEFGRLPGDIAAIDRVKAIAKELTNTAKSFDFNVPDDVKRFLQSIQVDGASLAQLTKAVVDWLKENKAFDQYRIVPRSQDGN